MANLPLVLTLGLFCFVNTLFENRATAISKSDFRLSVSSTAYPGNRDKDVVATTALKETWKTLVQTTKQLTSTSGTHIRKDKKIIVTTVVKNKPLCSLSKSYPASQTRKNIVSNILSTEKLAGKPSSNSRSSCSYCVSFTKNIHDVEFSFSIPFIKPEIASTTSLFSGFISSRPFLKDKVYSTSISRTQPNFDTDSRETFTRAISLDSFGNNFVSQVLTSQLPFRTSTLVDEIRDFSKLDTSIRDPGDNKVFTVGSDSFTEFPSNVLSSNIWKRLNLISKFPSRPNVTSQVKTTTISFSNTIVVETSQTVIKSSFSDINRISQMHIERNEMTFPATSSSSSNTMRSVSVTDSISGPNNFFSARQSSPFSGNSRIFSSIMASPPALPNSKEQFDSRTSGVISATPVVNKYDRRTKLKESPSYSASELNAEVVKSSVQFGRLHLSSSRVCATCPQILVQMTSVGYSVPTRFSKHSTIQKDASSTSVRKSQGFRSLNTHTPKPLVISETVRLSTAIKEISSLTGSINTRISLSTQTSEAGKENSVNKRRFMISSTKLSPTMTLLSPDSTLASSKSPTTAAHFSSPVLRIVKRTELRTKQFEPSVPVGNSRDMSVQRSLHSIKPTRTVDYSTQSSADNSWTMSDIRTDLSSKQFNSPHSQTKSYRQPSCSEYTTKLPTQDPPSVASLVSMAVSSPISGKFGASVITQTKPVPSKLKVMPLSELPTSQKPIPIKVKAQSSPTETSSATVVGNMSTENLPTALSDSSASHVKLLIVVAIVPSVILCAIFAAVILFRRNRKRRNTPVYSIKVEYLDEKKFRKRCVNSRLDLSLKGIHIDLEYSSAGSERRNSYPRDIALLSRGSNLGEMQMRDLDLQFRKQNDNVDLEWRNGVILRVRETSLNSRSQPTVRDSIYSVKEKENFEPSEKVVHRESSKRGRESVTWRIPVVQRQDSEDFDQRCSVCTDDTALFPEEPAESVHELVNTLNREDKAFEKHEKENNPINSVKDRLRVQLSNKKLDKQTNQIKEKDSKENKLTVELKSQKKEGSRRSSSPRLKFGTL